MVAPAYDSMAPVERSAYIKANPSNFIKTMRTPEDYFELEKPSLEMVLDHNSNEVQKMLEDSSFEIHSRRRCIFIDCMPEIMFRRLSLQRCR